MDFGRFDSYTLPPPSLAGSPAYALAASDRQLCPDVPPGIGRDLCGWVVGTRRTGNITSATVQNSRHDCSTETSRDRPGASDKHAHASSPSGHRISDTTYGQVG